MQPLSSNHPLMIAWNSFCSTEEFKNALRWATETHYEDGRPILDEFRQEHAKGALWLAFTRGMEIALAAPVGSIAPSATPDCAPSS